MTRPAEPPTLTDEQIATHLQTAAILALDRRTTVVVTIRDFKSALTELQALRARETALDRQAIRGAIGRLYWAIPPGIARTELRELEALLLAATRLPTPAREER